MAATKLSSLCRNIAGAFLMLPLLCALPSQAQAQYHQNFRVATLNVRHVTADDTGAHSWANRQAGVLVSVRANNPDIFGLQEASNAPIKTAFETEFSEDYDFHKPSGGSPKYIFFRKSRFERLSPDQNGNFYLANPYAESESCHSNANGRTVAWIKLRDRESGRIYMIINLHTAHAGKCWKARNEAATRLHQLLAEHADTGATFVLMGDLNIDEQAPSVDSRDKLVTTLEQDKPGYAMRMSARHSGNTGKSQRTFNSAWKTSSTSYRRLDYIFVNSVDATTYRTAIDHRSINEVMGTGANISPSDHYLVRAEVRQAPFTYEPVRTSVEGISTDQYSFGDVNGDRKTDLILWKSTVESGRVRVHLADGNGGFDPVAKIDANTGVSGEWRFFADIDGDRCADRISWSATIDGGALRVGKSNCDASFEIGRASCRGSTKGGTKWYFARLNDDACMDRIAWHPEISGGQTRVALAKCDGTLGFEAEHLSSDGGETTNAGAHISFADIDGDGLDDKIVWDLNLRGGRTTVFASLGNGDFDLLSEHSGGSSGNAETQFYFGDTDGDGHAEKIFWRHNYHQGVLKMYPGAADGFIGHPMVVNNGPSTDKNTAYQLADVTGDGSADLIRWNRSSAPGKITVYPALLFQEQPAWPDPEEPDAGTNPNDVDAGADTVNEMPDGSDIWSADVAYPDAPEDGDEPDDAEQTSTNLSGNAGCGCATAGQNFGAGWLSFVLFVLVGRIFRRARAHN